MSTRSQTRAQRRKVGTMMRLLTGGLSNVLLALPGDGLERLVPEQERIVELFGEMLVRLAESPEQHMEQRMLDQAIGEYKGCTQKELDLESLLGRTLDFILEKAGPTNVAIFLPVTADEFTLGGYGSYDLVSHPMILLEEIVDDFVPRVAMEDSAISLTDTNEITDWCGRTLGRNLAHDHVFAIPCWTNDEVLAVIVLFRTKEEPFLPELELILTAIAPILAEQLARIVRVHHRHLGVE